MQLSVIASIKDMFRYMKGRLITVKEEQEQAKILPSVMQEKAATDVGNTIIPDHDEKGEPVFKENVVYIKWPLKTRLFMDIREESGGQMELQRKTGVYNGGTNVSSEDSFDENADVLTIPDVIHIPVIRPVLQDEKLMNVDIITERGIFIGIGTRDASLYMETEEASGISVAPGFPSLNPDVEKAEKVATKNFAGGSDELFGAYQASPFIAPSDETIKAKSEDMIPPDIQDIFAKLEDMHHEDANDDELPNPEKSGINSGISSAKHKRK